MSWTVRKSAWLDIVAMTALLLSYLWIWQRTFPGELFVCIALVVGLAVWSHRRRGETPRDLGFRLPTTWLRLRSRSFPSSVR